MSKHSKALRELFRVVESGIPCQARYRDKLWAESHAAADHMEKLERQLRVARKALRRLSEDDCNYSAYAESTLLDMRQAGRKK